LLEVEAQQRPNPGSGLSGLCFDPACQPLTNPHAFTQPRAQPPQSALQLADPGKNRTPIVVAALELSAMPYPLIVMSGRGARPHISHRRRARLSQYAELTTGLRQGTRA